MLFKSCPSLKNIKNKILNDKKNLYYAGRCTQNYVARTRKLSLIIIVVYAVVIYHNILGKR